MMMDEFPGGWPVTRSPSWLNPYSSMAPQQDYYYPGSRSFNRHFSPFPNFGWDPIFAPVTRRKTKSPFNTAAQPLKNGRKPKSKKPNLAPTKPKPEDVATAMESDQLNATSPTLATPELVTNSPNAISESASSEYKEVLVDSLKDGELELESSLLSSKDESVSVPTDSCEMKRL